MVPAVRVFAVLMLVGAALVALPAVDGNQVALADDVTVDGDCDQAEFDAALATAHLNGGGTIDFACPPDTTITLTSDKDITAEITIDGGDEITLSSGNTTRIFEVNSGGDLTLQNITLADGEASRDGGAVLNRGTLTVIASTFTGNEALDFGGAIANDGDIVDITASTFTGNDSAFLGGAIANTGGTVGITTSTFDGNSSPGGGALANVGSSSNLTVTASTFTGNNSAGSGGAIDNSLGTVAVANSTFSQNTATNNGGAVLTQDGTFDITSSTFVGNSAGSMGTAVNGSEGTDVTFTGSVLLGGSGLCAGTGFSSGGYNLTEDESCGFSGTGDQVVTPAAVNLGPLADNGGPTRTMLPMTPSDAINAIPTADCPVAEDQRGVTRPQIDACDIGAVEVAIDEISDHYLCANRYNGDLRMPRGANCASTEMLLTLPDDSPVNLCVNRYNGDARYSRTGRCASTEIDIEVLGDFSQPVCVNRYNGDVRVPRRAGQCASTEVTRLI